VTRVGCAPARTALPNGLDRAYVLYGYRPSPAVGCIGAALLRVVQAYSLKPTSRAWDFLSIALSVVAADEACPRNRSADGWTRQIDLTVSVVDPAFWTSQLALLQEALSFVTGDIWRVSFIGDGFLPTPPKPAKVRPENVVSLLSGGMDSLIGAIDLVTAGQRPLLVSQVAKGDKKEQVRFAKAIAPDCLHVQMNHNAAHVGLSERSQRARSLVFFGFGVLAATCLARYDAGQRVEMIVPENGFISLNVPLTPLRLGSLSTRTTHPHYLSKIQALLDAAGLNVQLRNPYQLNTKGEMLQGCGNQALLQKLVGSSTSCGRYARTAFTQCGRCVPCLVRRASFHHWGIADPTPTYKYLALSTPGPKYRDFDDVRAVAFAVETVRQRGADAWIGGALNSAQLGAVGDLRAVAQRGLSELEQFLIAQGVI
jgi:7-cyano-7-deazaguanine synthase in queuosine biosynthesis